MSVPRITFDLQGVTHSLYFGMAAIEIFSQKSVAELGVLAKENPKTPIKELKADSVKAFAYIIYAGLCNEADIKEAVRPSFEDAYYLADDIVNEGYKLQQDIFDCFNESRAHKSLIERLQPIEKKKKVTPVK